MESMHSRATIIVIAAALLGCGSSKSSEKEQIETSTFTITTTAITAAIVGAPMSGEAEVLYRDRDRASDEEARLSSEESVRSEMVLDPACVAFEWTGLEADVTFTDCVSARTGQGIDGNASLTVSIRPSTIFVFSFSSLTVGEFTFSGSITLEYTGSGEGPTSMVSADLAFAGASVTIDEIVVDVVGAVYTLDGPGHVTTASVDADFTATAVTLVEGDCLPTSGNISFAIVSGTTVVTFTADTPSTGLVSVQVADGEAEQMEVFAPCPT